MRSQRALANDLCAGFVGVMSLGSHRAGRRKPEMKELSSASAPRGSRVCTRGIPSPVNESILLIEDDGRIREIVERGLRARGFRVASAADGVSGVALARTGSFDLVLLDLVLPDAHGLVVLRALRALEARMPVVALTALDDMDAKVQGLDAGVDDYVTKPFSIEELGARIRARLRWRDESVLSAGALTLDLAAHRATLDGRDV